ncbi:OmpA family protein [Variovorax sp. J31P207]|uniref:OmpA/MotB family protein n=1 Tax=Variovorax sp. J31P207 TaxID=3053510 RepID=UPI0025789737|nr:OmpA family protein [Variovorax sp. J31P207]MDM0072140.1 OmpA family protein [Variovorax sp. J31P207]
MNSIKLNLVLCAAVLAAGCVTDKTYNTEVQKADTYAALDQKLSSQLSSDQAQITRLQNQLKVTMVNEVLFPEGGWSLSPKGEQALGTIAPTLSNLPGQQIVVQGFTDNEPIGPALKARFPSNLELSSARADNVARFLTSKGVPQNSISAQGFGEARPVASNDTPQGKAKNRRVEIVITAANRP